MAREGNNSHQLLEGLGRGEGVGRGPAAKRFRERGEWGTLAHKVRAEEGGGLGTKQGAIRRRGVGSERRTRRSRVAALAHKSGTCNETTTRRNSMPDDDVAAGS